MGPKWASDFLCNKFNVNLKTLQKNKFALTINNDTSHHSEAFILNKVHAKF